MTTLDALFEPGLIDRLRGQYESVDVDALAGQVRDMAKRKGVRNPNGLLVTWVRRAARQRPIAIGTAVDRDELELYATFHVNLYRSIATERLSPHEVASRLVRARADGLPRLNPFVVDALNALGASWNGEA